MSQFERIACIDRLLREQGSVRTAEVAERFEVSGRQVKRDIEYLRDRLDAPVVSAELLSNLESHLARDSSPDVRAHQLRALPGRAIVYRRFHHRLPGHTPGQASPTSCTWAQRPSAASGASNRNGSSTTRVTGTCGAAELAPEAACGAGSRLRRGALHGHNRPRGGLDRAFGQGAVLRFGRGGFAPPELRKACERRDTEDGEKGGDIVHRATPRMDSWRRRRSGRA